MALPAPAEMGNLGILVKLDASAVADEIAHDGITLGFGMALDGMTDIAHVSTGPHLLDPQGEAFAGHSNQTPGLFADISDEIHAAGVAEISVQGRGHVHVHDIPIEQHAILGNTVAHHFIDRRADTFGEIFVIEGGGHPAVRDGMLMHPSVDLIGGHAGCDPFLEHIEDIPGDCARPADTFNLFGSLDRRRRTPPRAGLPDGRPRSRFGLGIAVLRQMAFFVFLARSTPTRIVSAGSLLVWGVSHGEAWWGE